MWSTDDSSFPATEDWIRDAEWTPVASPGFRDRVLESAILAQRKSVSLHRIQTLTTSLLAAGMLLFLPGYYQSLRDPMPPSVDAPVRSTQPRTLARGYGFDSYEWALVESALAARDEDARAFRGTL